MELTSFDQIMMIRMLERLIAVIVGPLAIYFGYKLFLLLPMQNDSKGKITLPGFSVVLSKAGPGIFFAAFGSILVYQSITNEVIVKTPQGEISGSVALSPPASDPEDKKNPGVARQNITPQKVETVRQAIQMLNCMQAVSVESVPGVSRQDTQEPVRLAKEALLATVWQEQKWGEQTKLANLEDNIIMEVGDIPEDLKEIYTTKLPGCPK